MKRRPWTAAEDAIIRERYPDLSAAEVAALLDRGIKAVYERAHQLRIYKDRAWIADRARRRSLDPNHGGRAHQFTPGQTPWNKGTHFTAGGRSAETRFKPGRPPQLAHNYLPIGSERLCKDGYLERKISDDRRVAPARRWRGVHILLWESVNGPLPIGHAVVFKDGDKRHITIDNLELVTRAELMRRNTTHRHGKEIAALTQLRGALKRQINRRTKNQPEEIQP